MPRIVHFDPLKDLEKIFPLICQLRPHLTKETFVTICQAAKDSDGYTIVGIEENDQPLALMGYRILYDLVRGKHFYIDDLVTEERHRSQGLGAQLLNWAEGQAAVMGCRVLRLCTGIENVDGVKFYERQGWTRRAFAYTKKI